MTSAHLYIKPQTKTIHAEHRHNIYNIRYNITKLAGQLHDFEKTSINEAVFMLRKLDSGELIRMLSLA